MIQGVDFNNDWKLVTLFIGGNNLCMSCILKVLFYYLALYLFYSLMILIHINFLAHALIYTFILLP